MNYSTLSVLPASRSNDSWAHFKSTLSSIIRRKGEYLFHQGDKVLGGYLIESGWVQLSRRTPNGKLQIFGRFSSGCCLGLDEIMMNQESFDLDAKSLGDVCSLYFSRQDILYRVHQMPSEYRAVLESLTQMIKNLQERLKHTLNKNLQEQVASILLEQLRCAQTVKDSSPIMHMTNDEIAGFIGRTPEAVSKFICHLRGKRILERQNGHIIIHDLKRLTDNYATDQSPNVSSSLA